MDWSKSEAPEKQQKEKATGGSHFPKASPRPAGLTSGVSLREEDIMFKNVGVLTENLPPP